MSRFLAPRLFDMEAYSPGEQPRDKRYIKLNTNESPYPPPPEMRKTLEGRVTDFLRLYPDPEGTELTEALAAHYGLLPEEVFLGNGSDDILNLAFWAFGDRGVSFPEIGYSFYPVTCRLHGLKARPVPLQADFSIRPEDYYDSPGMISIANPNAPTGMALTRAQIRDILKRNRDNVVLIDEAYVDFGAESAVPLLAEFDNLLVVMTFSKSRSLAGARIGFAMGAKDLIADLKLLKYSTNPYSVSQLDMLAGIAAVAYATEFAKNCEKIVTTREKTVVELQKQGFEVLPSQANFVFAAHPAVDGGAIYAALKARWILVRHFDKPGISRYIRITIGTEEEMEALLLALHAVLQEKR